MLIELNSTFPVNLPQRKPPPIHQERANTICLSATTSDNFDKTSVSLATGLVSPSPSPGLSANVPTPFEFGAQHGPCFYQ
jgi:hypothetical protein